MESVVAPEELLKIVSNEFYMTPPRSCTVYYVARKLINDCFIPKENETEDNFYYIFIIFLQRGDKYK